MLLAVLGSVVLVVLVSVAVVFQKDWLYQVRINCPGRYLNGRPDDDITHKSMSLESPHILTIQCTK